MYLPGAIYAHTLPMPSFMITETHQASGASQDSTALGNDRWKTIRHWAMIDGRGSQPRVRQPRQIAPDTMF